MFVFLSLSLSLSHSLFFSISLSHTNILMTVDHFHVDNAWDMLTEGRYSDVGGRWNQREARTPEVAEPADEKKTRVRWRGRQPI